MAVRLPFSREAGWQPGVESSFCSNHALRGLWGMMTQDLLLMRKQSGRATNLTATVCQLRGSMHGDKNPENNEITHSQEA